MKQLFTLLLLVCGMATGSVADVLYCVIDGTSATIRYGEKPSGAWSYNSIYQNGVWDSFSSFLEKARTVTTVTIDESCKNYTGKSLKGFFYEWYVLETINGLENLGSSDVTNMNSMFLQCKKLTSLNLTSLNTQKVTNMACMFDGCIELETLDVSTWDTGNVTTMYQMFSDCKALTFLDFSSFNTTKVETTRSMFANCSSLRTLIVGSGWNTDNINANPPYREDDYMFYGCTSLVGGDGTTYDGINFGKSKAYAGDGGYLTSYSQIYAYTVTNDEVTITGFASDFDVPENYDLVIPDMIDGKPVVEISPDCSMGFKKPFKNTERLNSLHIGRNVRTIRQNALKYMVNITAFTFAEGSQLETIEYNACDCSMDNPNTKLKSIVFPSSLIALGAQSFDNFSILEEITFKGIKPGYTQNLPGIKFNGTTHNAIKNVNVLLEYMDDFAGDIGSYTNNGITSIKAQYALPTSGIGSFSTSVPVTLPEGLDAYYCKDYDPTNGTIGVTSIEGTIPASTGVLLKGTGGETYTISASSAIPDAITDNALVAVTEQTSIPQISDDYTNFGLSGGEFKKVNEAGGTVKANRAYLRILTSELLSETNARDISLVWNEDVTRVNDVRSNTDDARGGYYNLNGQRVIHPTKGVYVVNGKKVIIK